MGATGPTGPTGAMGAMGSPGGVAVFDLAVPPGADLAGFIPPQAITCLPGKEFCVNSTQLGTCTLSGADAILGQDCVKVGSTTNPASCVTTGCPSGQTACCRRQNQLWQWSFTSPSLAGSAFIPDYAAPNVYLSMSKTCAPTGSGLTLSSASLGRQISMCPSDALYIYAAFDRKVVSVGMTETLPPASGDGSFLSAAIGVGLSCSQWTGTMRIDSDAPSWSVTINATCTQPGVTLSVNGTMSGNE